MKSVMIAVVVVFMAGCMAEEDAPLDDQDVASTTGAVEEPVPEDDLWPIRRLMRQQCYSGCDSEQDSCLTGACVIHGECGGTIGPGGVSNDHVADCQGQASQCNRSCACTFGGPNLGSCG